MEGCGKYLNFYKFIKKIVLYYVVKCLYLSLVSLYDLDLIALPRLLTYFVQRYSKYFNLKNLNIIR